VVRLQQGKKNLRTLYDKDILKVAKKWLDCGCRRLHIIDLDGAFSGKPENLGAIKEVIRFSKEHSMGLQVGGGIRSSKELKNYMDLGLDQVILGTHALESPQFFQEAVLKYPQKIILSLDVKEGEVFAKGWEKGTGKNISQVLDELSSFGLDQAFALIYTDISRDGMLSGPNLEGLEELLKISSLPIIVAGGIGVLKDILTLRDHFPKIFGIITGKAIYEGTLDLKEAIDALKN